MMRLFADADLKNLTGMALAGAELFIPEGNFFYVSATLRPNASFDDVRQKISGHLKELRSGSTSVPDPRMVGQQLAVQLTDPAALLAQVPPNADPAMAEGNVGVLYGMNEFRYSPHLSAIAQGLRALTAARVQNAMRTYLTDEKRAICTIAPKSK